MSYGTGFAPFYDRLNDEVDYGAWAGYITDIFDRYGAAPSLVLDLACGTGSLTCAMAGEGYDMIGIDNSSAMLEVARQKAQNHQYDILFSSQDMTSFELYGTVGAVFCCLDSVNYLTAKREVLRCFRRVSLFLEPGGLFIFDVNTKYKYENVLAFNSFVYDLGDLFCGWRNLYDRRSRLCRFDLTVFEQKDGTFLRHDEEHLQRMYEEEELKAMCRQSGLAVLGVFDELTFKRPGKRCERMFFVCRKEN